MTPASDDLLAYECPRCRTSVTERVYGPCEGCRADLRATMSREPVGAGAAEAGRFEPRMNVVPNQVATKE